MSSQEDAKPRGIFRKVVLTGGPCGGKTTTQSVLTETFENDGWKVYHVPETATVLLNGGVVFSELTPAQATKFQEDLLKTLLAVEDTFFDLGQADAENGKKVIAICDRGAMDPKAYCDPAEWDEMVKKFGLSDVLLRDARYDCIVHLVTAATGAEEFYSKATNAIRSESVEFARELDKKTANVWVGHPYYDVIDNSTNFQTKLMRVVAAVKKRLQIEDKRGDNITKRKFLLASNPLEAEYPIRFQDFHVEHEYLVSTDGTQIRIRKRGQTDFTYTVTYRQITQGQKVETRRDISYREYEILKAQKDPNIETITKTRRCFVWDNQYFQIDLYHHPRPGLALLEAYMPTDGAMDSLPPFLKIEREVTQDTEFSMFNLSQKNPSKGKHGHHHHHHHHRHSKKQKVGGDDSSSVDGDNSGNTSEAKGE